jgi:hypothetical protein
MSLNDKDLSPSQTPQQPFTPQAPGDPSSGGCGRAGLIGCGVLTLLLGAAAIVFLLKADDLFGWAMENFQAQIMQSLPDDLEDEEAARLRRAFDSAIAAVQKGTVDPRALQQMQEQLRQSMWESGQTLTRDQVIRLTEALEEVGNSDEPLPDPGNDVSPDS